MNLSQKIVCKYTKNISINGNQTAFFENILVGKIILLKPFG